MAMPARAQVARGSARRRANGERGGRRRDVPSDHSPTGGGEDMAEVNLRLAAIAAYPRTTRETPGVNVMRRTVPYNNKRIAQDRRGSIQQYYPRRGFGSCTAAARAERDETLADGRRYTVQYYERSRLERSVRASGPVQSGTLGLQLRGRALLPDDRAQRRGPLPGLLGGQRERGGTRPPARGGAPGTPGRRSNLHRAVVRASLTDIPCRRRSTGRRPAWPAGAARPGPPSAARFPVARCGGGGSVPDATPRTLSRPDRASPCRHRPG